MDKKNKTYLLVSLGWFVIVAIIGFLIRMMYVTPLGLTYKYLLHAHSHIAFLGWGFNALIIGLIFKFSSKPRQYDRLFWMTQICIFLFAAGFLTQGYHIVSITFSTLFLLVSYWYANKLRKELNLKKSTPATKFAKASLFYLVLASIGPWLMGPIMAMKMIHSIPYFLGIFFYLHFTYNGFFVMAMIAILFQQMEDDGVKLPSKQTNSFYFWTNFAVIPTYALSALWVKPHFSIYVIAFISSVIQLVALVRFFPTLKVVYLTWKPNLSKITKKLFYIAFIAFSLKLITQILSSFPIVADVGYKLKNYFVIGYLHMIFLGLFSLFFLAWHIHVKGYKENKISKTGIYIFLVGFILTEILLFGNGFLTWSRIDIMTNFTKSMLIFSALMPTGLIMFLIGQRKSIKT